MNNTHRHIIKVLIPLLFAGLFFQGCREEDFGEKIPDRESMIRQGKYLSARSDEATTGLEDSDKSAWFPVGTPYRLLAFSKPDKGVDDPDATMLASKPRFNKVAWEGDTGGLRYINVAANPDLWFGFSPVGDEESGPEGRVSLDFYGFTYGKEADHTTDYIEIDGLEGEKLPSYGSLRTLKRTETVTDGKLRDLLRGKLLNRSISTVSGPTSTSQSVIPFRHCFSQLQFLMVQQPAEDGVTPAFPDIYIDRVDVTGTYMEGSVYLWNGKVMLPDTDAKGNPNKGSRTLALTNREAVPIVQTAIGEMLVFPSDGNAIAEGSDANIGEAGYLVGLDITLKCPDKKVIDNFLAKSGSTETAVQGEDNYWYAVIRKTELINSYSNKTLYFSPNNSYTLVISLQDDAVRIITVIPQVEEWLPGEGTEEYPWQEQPLGQPQMFDNIVWSDRNLGSDHFDPLVDYERTVGYFYQAGRNIPYFPFDTREYAHTGSPKGTPVPTSADKRKGSIAGETTYQKTVYRLYPMVDDVRLLKMYRQDNCPVSNGSKDSSWLWSIAKSDPDSVAPQMYIPETKPTNAYFDFMRGQINDGLSKEQDMEWNKGQKNQPVAGSWVVPSSRDFMSIFPTTPFAGNITFRRCSGGSNVMDWFGNGTMAEEYKTLRVTVPYYKVDMAEPSGKTTKYLEAWHTLKDNNDPGTTQEGAYQNKPNTYGAEPDGDPEDGYASVYVISRAAGDVETLPDVYNPDPTNKRYKITNWGTIYAIKRIYTNQAYRMRWRVLVDPVVHGDSPALYIEICRYRCNIDDTLDETNYKLYDWEHPAARLYFPICGLGDWTGAYINFGTECQYATSDPIVDGKTSAVQIKITGDDDYNEYISVVKGVINRNFGMQIRPVGGR